MCNGALGDVSHWLQQRLTEGGVKTEIGRTEVHRRCNLPGTISFLVPSPLSPLQLQSLHALE